jgi:hypothetical protein
MALILSTSRMPITTVLIPAHYQVSSKPESVSMGDLKPGPDAEALAQRHGACIAWRAAVIRFSSGRSDRLCELA